MGKTPRNAGIQVEAEILRQFEQYGSFMIKGYKGNIQNIQKGENSVYTPGEYGTKCKFDIRIGNYRLQVKSGTGNSATVFSARLQALCNCAEREMFDFSLISELYARIEENGKKVKLSELSDKEDWRDILQYFLFEGTAGSQEMPAMQANYLIFWGKKEQVFCDKNQAIDYLFNNLYGEIKIKRTSKSQYPVLSVRIA